MNVDVSVLGGIIQGTEASGISWADEAITVSAVKPKEAKVRVRAYSNTSGKRVYSAWSAAKSA